MSEQNRFFGVNGNVLNLLDELVEAGVTSLNAGFEE